MTDETFAALLMANALLAPIADIAALYLATTF